MSDPKRPKPSGVLRGIWDQPEMNPKTPFRPPPSLGDLRRKGMFDAPVVGVPDPSPDRNTEPPEAARPHRSLTPEITGHQALLAFLPEPDRRMLEGCLRREGIGTVVAETAGAALSAILERRPTFVFTSIEFAPLHSPSLIAALKACPDHRSIPLIVLTPQDPRLLDLSLYRPDCAVESGPELVASVVSYLDQIRIRRRDPAVSGHSPWLKMRGRILLAEASILAQRLVGKELHVAGAEVTVVESSPELMLAMVAREFDLVILDLEMPSANGGDATELIRFLRAVGDDLPIIGLRSEGSSTLIPDGLDAILPKPARRRHLFELCNHLLRKRLHAA